MFDLHLPTIEMIAGDTCPFAFHLTNALHMDVNTSECKAYFSISPYVNISDEPIISMETTFIDAGELDFQLTPESTIGLQGKYVYQLFLTNGGQSEVYGGYLIVYPNRNKGAIVAANAARE